MFTESEELPEEDLTMVYIDKLLRIFTYFIKIFPNIDLLCLIVF